MLLRAVLILLEKVLTVTNLRKAVAGARKVARGQGISSQAQRKRAELRRVEGRIANLVDALGEGRQSQAIHNALDKAEQRKALLLSELQQGQIDVHGLPTAEEISISVAEFRRVLKAGAPMPILKRHVRACFQGITVHPKEGQAKLVIAPLGIQSEQEFVYQVEESGQLKQVTPAV